MSGPPADPPAREDAGPIDLSALPPFRLGSLEIRPSTREVRAADGALHLIEPRVMQVLAALAQAKGAVVSRDTLVLRCWDGRIVGDDAINRAVAKARQAADLAAPAAFAIETIARVGYRLLEAGRGDPALGQAAPGGGEGFPSSKAGGPRRRRLIAAGLLCGGLLAVAAGVVGYRAYRGERRAASLVAVLPLETLSPGPGVRDLADNVADDVLGVLSANQVEALSRVDAAGLRGAVRSDEWARLGVGLLVDGSVQDDGKTTRLSVRLNDARTHVTLWSADYQRGAAEAADLGTEVAAQVADIVEIAEFARTNPPGLKDDAALSALLEAHTLIRGNRPDSWARLLDVAQRVVSIAPGFALGRSTLSLANAYAVRWNVMPQQSAAMAAASRREAYRALAVDPRDAGAYFSLAILAPTYREKDAILLKGLAAEGHPAAAFGAVNNLEADLLQSVGRLREALPFAQRALALDSLSPPKTGSLIWGYAALGQTAAARELLDQGLRQWPNHHDIRQVRLHMLAFYGTPAEAIAVLDDPAERPADLTPQAVAAWRSFLDTKQSAGGKLSARAAQSIARAADAGEIAPGVAATMLSSLGDVDLAFDEANRALKGPDRDPSFLFTPATGAMRRDPRFMPLAARLGLVEYWRGTGKWPDFCAGPHAQVDCRAAAAKAGV